MCIVPKGPYDEVFGTWVADFREVFVHDKLNFLKRFTMSIARGKCIAYLRTCPFPPWYKIESIGWQAGNGVYEDTDGFERVINPSEWRNPTAS